MSFGYLDPFIPITIAAAFPVGMSISNFFRNLGTFTGDIEAAGLMGMLRTEGKRFATKIEGTAKILP